MSATDRSTRITEEPNPPGKPFGWIGAAALLTATAAAAALPPSHAPARVLVVAAVVGCCAAVLPGRVTLALAGFACVLATTFLSQEVATALVISAEDLWNLVVLGLATGLGVGQRWIRALRADVDLDAELRDLIDEAEFENR